MNAVVRVRRWRKEYKVVSGQEATLSWCVCACVCVCLFLFFFGLCLRGWHQAQRLVTNRNVVSIGRDGGDAPRVCAARRSIYTLYDSTKKVVGGGLLSSRNDLEEAGRRRPRKTEKVPFRSAFSRARSMRKNRTPLVFYLASEIPSCHASDLIRAR